MIQTWKEEVEHIECNRKKEAERTKRIHRDQAEMRRQELEPERRRLDIEGRESSDSLARGLSGSRDIETYKMSKLMQPFNVGEDIGFYLINFERMCKKLSFSEEMWPEHLLTLLPCEAL